MEQKVKNMLSFIEKWVKIYLLGLIYFCFVNPCFPQFKKEIIVAAADSLNYKYCVAFNEKYNLIDLSQSTDSLFIRYSLTSKFSHNTFIGELRKNEKGWQGRIITIGAKDCYNICLAFKLFNNYYLYRSKQQKTIKYKSQIKIDPATFFKSHNISETFGDTLFASDFIQKLSQFRSQSEYDTSIYKEKLDSSDFGGKLDIEIATNSTYKYVHWLSPYYYYYVFKPDILIDMVFDIEIAFINILDNNSYRNYKFKNYHKNHWPK